MADAPLFCPRCGQPMRHEGAHERCPFCGWLTHCCEGDMAMPVPGEAPPLRTPATVETDESRPPRPLAKAKSGRGEPKKRSTG